MRFGDILGKSKILNTAFLNEEVVGLSQESKTISNGELFFNLCEDYENSLKYSKEALERGAKFVVSQIKLPIEKLCFSPSFEVEQPVSSMQTVSQKVKIKFTCFIR